MDTEPHPHRSENTDDSPNSRLLARCLFGGTLMGLANLVPGISGGTMLLVSGIYPAFIDSLASLTRLKVNRKTMLVLGSVGLSAGISILIFAGLLKELVLDHRWVMYSLFIGLTLGGVPLIWQKVKPISARFIFAAIGSFAFMLSLAILQASGVVGTTGETYLSYFLAGIIAAAAMVLPGISGSYLWLLMGKYILILAAIDQLKQSLTSRDLKTLGEPLHIIVPVACGVAVGILLAGNLLKWLLQRHPQPMLGFLLGLLLGSLAGLYPFQEGLPPQVGDTIKGMAVTAENIARFDKKDWLVESRIPQLGEAATSMVLIALGFLLTRVIVALGSDNKSTGARA
jgi:putative membrane protein